MLEPNYSLFTCLKPHLYIIQIDYCHCIHQIKIGSLNSKSNNRNYSVNNTREACQLNLYPITNNTNYKFECIVWPFWSPYICKPHFTIYTIYLTNQFALGQSWNHPMIVQCFLTKLLKFPMKLHTLVNEYFGWGTKDAKHPIYKCTSSSFTIMTQQWHQL